MDNNCCLKVGHVKNGELVFTTVVCENVSPLDIASDELDNEILRKHISSSMNIVLTGVEKEEIDIPWE
jgi:hypothetical protein